MTVDTLILKQDNLTKIKKPFSGIKELGQPLYPIDALPSPIGEAVLSYQRYGQQPISLIACSALANVSLACQCLANVARDKMLVSPTSLYFLVIAVSGERKSAADSVFGQAIRTWEQKICKTLEAEVQLAKTLHQAWRMEKSGILSQLRKVNLHSLEILRLKDEYIELCANEPEIPLLPKLFFEDTTQEGLASQLANGWANASLWSDEGATILASQGMQANMTKFVALLNRLWDGKKFSAHRKTTENFTIENRRLTVSLMMQPLILQQALQRAEGVSRQSGFLARSLIAYPESSMGERYYQEPPSDLIAIEKYNQYIHTCLAQTEYLDISGCKDVPTLTFHPKAKNFWIKFFNETESGLTKTYRWAHIKDFASKAAENVARLAALFHLFTGKNGEIDLEDVERATMIVHWHLMETKRILGDQTLTATEVDANKILRWMSEKNFQEISKSYLLQYSPIREKMKANTAINLLLENKLISISVINGKNMIKINS